MPESLTEEKLIPCPFCGSSTAPALMTSHEINKRGCADENCECDCHDCEHENVAVCCDFGNGGCGATGGYEIRRDKAVARWNRRPS